MADDQPQANDGSAPGKKIIIDEDWKSQVEVEKETLDEKDEAEQELKRGPMPSASLSLLITQLATQASIGLGDVEHPSTGKPEPDPELAKHCIDMLDVLVEKTKGNTDPDEKRLLDTVLFQLRMRYVSMTRGSDQ